MFAVAELQGRATEYRKRAEQCRMRADKSYNWQEEDSWLELASCWVQLAEASEREGHLARN